MKVFKGSVWKFGDNISTDLLMPGRSMRGKIDPSERKYYCMEAVRPDFARNVVPGDIVIGGKNFGYGASRPGVRNLQALGISCVIADSVATLFFRNCVSVAFPVLMCDGISRAFEEKDVAEVDLEKGEVRNITKGITLKGEAYPPFLLKIIEQGGILDLFKRDKKLSEL